ncbi:iron ABC transporter substrate-binding protein [Wukongibacter sp. M2B1]|uniref:iron ABC transporter substrate-binding protein n=1 Tax=Wukongibacter sp. M2B1 TaxID=3088895 RepID=UPI003D79E836
MNKKSISLLITAFMIMTFLFSGCISKSSTDLDTASNSTSDSQGIIITDMLDRKVTLDSTAKKAIAIGPGALRLYCYLGNIDNLVGVEQIENKYPIGRPYAIANPSLMDIEVIGPGGPKNSPDPEKIISVRPDVIFTTYSYEKTTADELQSKTGIPVIALSYGKVATFDPSVYKSIEIIGKAMGEEKRADEVIKFMEECKNDLNDRTKDISDEERPSAYVGALGYKGAHGIESTRCNYALFNAVHAKNVVDEVGKAGHFMIDKEKLLEWDPNRIFIDYGGFDLVKEDYNKNPDYYNSLTAFKKGEVYSQLPYNFYSTNIGTSIADAYFIGKVLYPDRFEDIEPEKKADEIYKFLFGKEVYSQMANDFGGFSKVTMEE